MAVAALAALAVTAVPTLGKSKSTAGRVGGVAVGGFGVHVAAGHERDEVELRDVGRIASRLLGLDTASVGAVDSAATLPTGDVLDGPDACLVIAVDGLDVASLASFSAPFLREQFAGAHLSLAPTRFFGVGVEGDGHDVKLGTALSYGRTSLTQLLRAQHPEAVVVAASNDAALVRAARPTIAVHDESVGELELFKSVAARVGAVAAADDAPDIVVLAVSEVRRAAGNKEALEKAVEALDAALPDIIESVQAVYGGRVATQIVLLGNALTDEHARLLQDATGNNTNPGTAATIVPLDFLRTNEIADYLLISWTAVFLIIFLLLLFICVPWASPLDPILYSSLAREDTKED